MTRRLLLVACAALALAACGKKGLPVPPEQRIPRPVTGLAATVREGAVELVWTNPVRRADNTRLTDLVTARVYRNEDDGAGEPKPALLSRGRILGYPELARLNLVLTPAAPGGPPVPTGPPPTAPVSWTIQGQSIRLVDRKELAFGRRYTYVVITEDISGRVSPPSSRVSVFYVAPPAAPVALAAQPGDREVRLSWNAPTTLADGTPLTQPAEYEVLRAATPDAPLEVITPTPLATPGFIDRNLENDRAYAYAVRAVRRQGTTLAASALSPRVTATPIAMTAPAPPTNVAATVAGATVRLSWTASAGPDVGAYIVYRADARGAFARVGRSAAPATTFEDRDLAPGRYRYAVTAQDTSASGNESRHSAEITVTVP